MYAKPSALLRGNLTAALLAISSVSTLPATAANFPNHAIRLIIPYSVGGGADPAARAVADAMSKSLGQPIVIENRGGASAIVGTNVAAKAPPDGYTIIYSTDANLVLNPLLYKKLVYDPDRDFTPIGLLAEIPQMIVSSPSIPPRNIKELVQYGKDHPDALNYSSPGRGGNGDLGAVMFMQDFNINMTSVPFKGGGDALEAVLAGTVQVYSGTTAIALPLIKAGKLIPIAVLTLHRQAALPDVPTVAESGAPGFESTLRVGLAAPSKTPPEVIARLNKALNDALSQPALRQLLERQGFSPAQPGTPADYAAANEQAKKMWGQLIRSKHISLD
jgi:tripartite-type tricarboxylate transporter receptor subunit TctC